MSPEVDLGGDNANCVDRIYQLATQLDGITAVTELLAQETRSRSCGLMLQSKHDFKAYGGWFWGMDQIWALAYRDRYYLCDPTVVEHFQVAPDTAYASRFDHDNAEFRASPFYSEWCAPQRLGYFAGAYHEISGDPQQLTLRLTFQGDFKRGPYKAPTLRLMEQVLPHLRRAVEINRKVTKLIGHSRALDAVLERSSNAMMLFDPNGELIYSNAAADALRGKGFDLRGKCIKLANAAAQAQFDAALASCCGALAQWRAPVMQAGCHVAIPRRGQLPLSAYLSPFRLNGTSRMDPLPSDIVMLQIIDPQQQIRLNAARLQQVMGLSAAESRVGAWLGRGETAQQIGVALSLSPHTVRDHIKRIYQRLGVSTQSEFVARAYSALRLHADAGDGHDHANDAS